jgi:hypothetical protein
MLIFKSINFIILINVLFSLFYCIIEPVRNPVNIAIFLSVVLLHLVYSFVVIIKLKNSNPTPALPTSWEGAKQLLNSLLIMRFLVWLKSFNSNPTPTLPASREGARKSIGLKPSLLAGRVGVGLSDSITKKHLIILFLFTRIAIFPMFPWLSDDVYTYLWQGKITSNGINVYTEMPESSKWIEYRDEVFDKMGNRNIPAIYPPLTVLINGSVHKIAKIFSDDWRFEYYLWKFILLISEFLAFLLFIKMIEIKDYIYPFIYCILPLTTIEIIGQGHNDGLLFVFLALLLYHLNTNPTPTLPEGEGEKQMLNNSLIKEVLVCLKFLKSNSNPTPALPTNEGEKAEPFLKPSLLAGRVWVGSEFKPTRLIKFWLELKPSLFIGLQIAFLTLVKIIPFAFIAVIIKMKIKTKNKVLILISSVIFVIAFSLPFILDYRAIEVFRSGQQYYNIVASFNSLPLIILRFVLELLNIKDWWIAAPYLIQFSRIMILAAAFLIIKPIDKSSTINGLIIFYLIPILISSKVHTWYFVPVIFLSLYNRNIALAFALQIFIFSYHYYLFIDITLIPYFDVLVWLLAVVTYYLTNKFLISSNCNYSAG